MPVNIKLRTLKRQQNMLLRAKEVLRVFQEHKIHDGVTNIWIYREVIYPRFLISKSTLDKYLDLNIEKKLNQVAEAIKNESNRD